jgi:glucan phosphorylase
VQQAVLTRCARSSHYAGQAASLSVRDRLIESWNDTNQHYREVDPKRVYYLSMEFLMGRSLLNSLYNLDLKETYTEALQQLGCATTQTCGASHASARVCTRALHTLHAC